MIKDFLRRASVAICRDTAKQGERSLRGLSWESLTGTSSTPALVWHSLPHSDRSWRTLLLHIPAHFHISPRLCLGGLAAG